MAPEDIEARFTYHAPTDAQAALYPQIRDAARSFAALLNQLCPESREKSLAVTHLENAVMWANASIARNS